MITILVHSPDCRMSMLYGVLTMPGAHDDDVISHCCHGQSRQCPSCHRPLGDHNSCFTGDICVIDVALSMNT